MLREKLSRAMDVAGVRLGREVLPSQDALYALRTEEGAAGQGLMHTDWPAAVCARYGDDTKPGSAIWAAFAAFELGGGLSASEPRRETRRETRREEHTWRRIVSLWADPFERF